MAICVGMQAMFEVSEEGDVPSLGIISGTVRRFDDARIQNDEPIKIPHSWLNRVDTDTDHMRQGCNHEYLYFTHTYCDPTPNNQLILAHTTYGQKFCSSIIWDNLLPPQSLS